jgi:hypothetical protein
MTRLRYRKNGIPRGNFPNILRIFARKFLLRIRGLPRYPLNAGEDGFVRVMGHDGVAVYRLILSTLAEPRFWSKKIKIAILAAATFAALC